MDRLSITRRPPGWPIMYQTWGRLLFLHWPIPTERLRPLIPERLTIDTFAGSAWIGVTPFTMWGIRPVLLPPLPGLSKSHELNVRTYVVHDGVPGVWFFSLDAAHPLAVWGARRFFHLPYFRARMALQQEGRTIRFASRRIHRNAPAADLEAAWTVGDALPPAEPDSVEFFLTERYCLYSARRERLYRARIFHRPWPLRRAGLHALSSTMIESHGLPTPDGPPLVHYGADALHVGVWPLKRVAG